MPEKVALVGIKVVKSALQTRPNLAQIDCDSVTASQCHDFWLKEAEELETPGS